MEGGEPYQDHFVIPSVKLSLWMFTFWKFYCIRSQKANDGCAEDLICETMASDSSYVARIKIQVSTMLPGQFNFQ